MESLLKAKYINKYYTNNILKNYNLYKNFINLKL